MVGYIKSTKLLDNKLKCYNNYNKNKEAKLQRRTDMNLYKVEQNRPVGYDCYDSFVIACKDEAEAIATNPGGDIWFTGDKDITITYLGIAAKGIEGIICKSFNAG